MFIKSEALYFIESIIEGWQTNSMMTSASRLLEKNKKALEKDVKIIFKHKTMSERNKKNKARNFLIQYVAKRTELNIDIEQLVFSGDKMTVEVILEDSFGVDTVDDDEIVVFPNQEEVTAIIAHCLFNKTTIKDSDIDAYLNFFIMGNIDVVPINQSLRYKTILWLVFLLIDIIHKDTNVCAEGMPYIQEKLEILLADVLDNKVINEDELPGPNYDNGIWNSSLFAFLQGGIKRKRLVNTLLDHLNFNNDSKHPSRCLLSKHRKCIYEMVLDIFCKQKKE
ncbi:hypothetical protein MHK_000568 [Candidatus Magnetomorum sp. HK-1]|nr:hypothetical protein MHK_000568 [Candidatus Magnetomorum sp. HK-1]